MGSSKKNQDIKPQDAIVATLFFTAIAGYFGGTGWAVGIFIFFSFFSLIAIIQSAFSKPDKKHKESLNTSFEYDTKNDSISDYVSPFQKPVNFGSVKKVGNSEFLLNPQSSLPIILKNANLATAKKVSDTLGNMPSWGDPSELTYLISQHNLEFPQIDEIISNIKPKIESSVEQQINSCEEWNESDNLDREDLKTEFIINAIESIDFGCISEDIIETLVFHKPEDLTADDEFLKSYSGDKNLLHFYFFQIGRGPRLVKIEADSHARSTWNEMVKTGLALQGKNIPIELLAKKLKVKEINEMFSDRLDKKIRLKSDAISYAMEQPDLLEKVSKIISLRELFVINPPDDVDVSVLESCYRYAGALAKIVQDTHNRCIRIEQTLKLAKPKSIWGIESEDCCHECSSLDGKEYKTKPKNLPPYHIGCNCRLDIDTGY